MIVEFINQKYLVNMFSVLNRFDCGNDGCDLSPAALTLSFPKDCCDIKREQVGGKGHYGALKNLKLFINAFITLICRRIAESSQEEQRASFHTNPNDKCL
jgi:hypothetical protein